MAIGMPPFQGAMMMPQAEHPLTNVYDQLGQTQVMPALVKAYGLNNQEYSVVTQFLNSNAANFLNDFCSRYLNNQGGYDPNMLCTLMYKFAENYLVAHIRGAQNRNIPALPNVSAFAAPQLAAGSSMDYYAIGMGNVNTSIVPNVPQNQTTGYIQEAIPNTQPVQNHIAAPRQETPMAPVIAQEEDPQGDISCSVDKLVIQPQSDEEKKWMDIINSSKAQTCKAMFHFVSDKNGEQYKFNHVKVHVPYSNKENAFMDMITAYPQLFVGNYATLMEFYTYLPMGIHFSQGKPIFDNLKDSFSKNPYALGNRVLEQSFGQAYGGQVSIISEDMIRMLNNMFGCYLSKVDANNHVEICKIEELVDIIAIQQGTDPSLTNFTKFEMYNDNALGCVKAAINAYFHILDPERRPYLRCEDEEMNLAASMEMSGIRVGDYIGRDFNLMHEENENVIKSIVDQLRKRTIGLKKHTVLFTNIDFPDTKRIAKYGRIAIKKVRHPLYFILQHLVENYPIDLYNIDLKETKDAIPMYLNVGVSVNGFMIIKIADYDPAM